MYTSMFRKAMLGDTALLALDFSSGTMPTAVTFTRADSTARATYIDASGYVKTVSAAGDPRFDYTGGVAKGLLIEAAATNILSYSAETSNAYWQKYLCTISGTLATAPDNTTSARLVIEDSGSIEPSLQKTSNTVDVSSAYTLSVWFKAPTSNARRYINLRINDNSSNANAASLMFDSQTGAISGAATAYGTITAASGSVVSYPGSWYRVSLTFTNSASITQIACKFQLSGAGTRTPDGSASAYTGDGVSGIYVWGTQLEKGSAASSYVPTTTASLTRLADDAVIRSTAWTSLYAQPGAMVVEFYRGAYGTGDRSILSTDPTATRLWNLKQANASATAQIAYSTGSATTQTGLTAGLNKVAIAWNAPSPTASFDLCVNGATPTFGGSNVGTTLSTWLTLGSKSTTGVSGSGTWDTYLNNSIKSVKYYPALTYAEMQANTT